jgi:cytochrome P450
MRESCPVAWTERSGGFWSLFRYADIVEATKDPGRFAQGRPQRGTARPPLEVNPPVHAAYRELLNPYFSRKVVRAAEPRVRRVVDDLLNPLVAAGGGDIASSFTYPLPTRVLCQFLNLPDEAWQLLDELSNQIYLNEEGRGGRPELVQEAENRLEEYGHRLVTGRRAAPLDRSTDLVSGMIAAELNGRSLTDEEIVQVLRLVFTAGHNSTTSSLGICLLHIARSGEIQRRLRDEPGLIAGAVSEFLRHETPVMAMPRTLTQDLALDGSQLRRGDQVYLVWASANRDPDVFPDPDQCLIDRRPNPHLVFGRGIHACIGRGLAELELRVAIEELLARTSWISLTGPVERTSWVRFGVSALPMRLEVQPS